MQFSLSSLTPGIRAAQHVRRNLDDRSEPHAPTAPDQMREPKVMRFLMDLSSRWFPVLAPESGSRRGKAEYEHAEQAQTQ